MNEAGLVIGAIDPGNGPPAERQRASRPTAGRRLADGRTGTEVCRIPLTAGPAMIQIGTEGGFLPAPVVIPSTPVEL